MVEFWNVLYENVLLEYMYVNGLNWAVPRLEVIRDNCRVAGSVETATATVATATISINGSDDSVVLVNEKHEKSKDNCSTDISVNIVEEPSAAGDINDDVEVEVEVVSSRKQLVPLGGMYVSSPLILHGHKSHSNLYSYSYSYICSYSYTYTSSYPLTGGKDSLVAWHLARSQGLHPVLLYVADGMLEYENNWRLNEIVSTIGTDIHIGKYRTLDFEFQVMTFVRYYRYLF